MTLLHVWVAAKLDVDLRVPFFELLNVHVHFWVAFEEVDAMLVAAAASVSGGERGSCCSERADGEELVQHPVAKYTKTKDSASLKSLGFKEVQSSCRVGVKVVVREYTKFLAAESWMESKECQAGGACH